VAVVSVPIRNRAFDYTAGWPNGATSWLPLRFLMSPALKRFGQDSAGRSFSQTRPDWKVFYLIEGSLAMDQMDIAVAWY